MMSVTKSVDKSSKSRGLNGISRKMLRIFDPRQGLYRTIDFKAMGLMGAGGGVCGR